MWCRVPRAELHAQYHDLVMCVGLHGSSLISLMIIVRSWVHELAMNLQCASSVHGAGAVGLDLSFVSHIFLLDPIWDKSLEDQVISRAHRLGAKQAIIVEKFIARGTVEQTMEALEHEPDVVLADVDRVGVSKGQNGDEGESSLDGVANGALDTGDARAEASSSTAASQRWQKRERGDDMKRQRETTRIRRVLTSLHSLPYDPDGERAREELSDSIEAARTSAGAALARGMGRGPPCLSEPLVGGSTRGDPFSSCTAEGDFIPAASFQGSKHGFVFKNGHRGLGYYVDGDTSSHSSRPTRQGRVVRFAE